MMNMLVNINERFFFLIIIFIFEELCHPELIICFHEINISSSFSDFDMPANDVESAYS